MMYRLKTIILLSGIISLLFSCDNKIQQTTDLDGIIDIDVGMEEGEKSAFTALIENVIFIPLETLDEALIGNIRKIICHNSDYYILLEREQGEIYRFDSQGRFLNKIGLRGRGPGEYIEAADFIVNSSGVIVLELYQTKLLFYDHNGNYKKSTFIDYRIEEITGMPDENLIFAVAGDNRHRKEAKGYEILILDLDGNLISAQLPNRSGVINFRYSYKSFPYDDKVIYSRPYHKFVYSSDRNEAVGRYSITMRDSPLPADFEEYCKGDNDRFWDNYMGKYNFFYGGLLENDDVVFFITLSKERQTYWNVYNKRTQEINTGSISLDKIEPSLFKAGAMVLLGLQNYLGSNGKDVIGYLNASMLSIEANDFRKDFPVLANLKSDDNPVLFRFTFK